MNKFAVLLFIKWITHVMYMLSNMNLFSHSDITELAYLTKSLEIALGAESDYVIGFTSDGHFVLRDGK